MGGTQVEVGVDSLRWGSGSGGTRHRWQSALVHQLELGARVPRQRRLASTDEHGRDEQVTLIDQPAICSNTIRQ